jgi:hypothetical protein
MSILDRGGRIAGRAAIEALGWAPGTRLHLDPGRRTHLTLRAAIDGTLTVKDNRYLWLPAATRHRLDLRPRRPGAAGRAAHTADAGGLPTRSP